MSYTLIPRDILESNKLSDRDKIVYLKINDFAYNQIYSFPTISKLADRLNKSKSTVKRATKQLRKYGLLKVYRKHERANNQYIIIPVDWVDWNKVDKSEQYIDDEKEFTELLQEIQDYYENIGSRFVDDEEENKTKIDILEDELKQEEYEFDKEDLVVLFKKYMRDIRGEMYNIDWGRDKKIMKDVFIDNPQIDDEEAMLVIKKLVEVYDREFSSDDYKRPEVWHLKVDWIFNKLVMLVLQDTEGYGGNNLDMDIADQELEQELF